MSYRTRDKLSLKSGLTLIEIILVLIIIIIIAGISLPNISGSHGNTKLLTAAKNIERLSRYSRGNAILREKHIIMAIDTEKNTIVVGEKKAILQGEYNENNSVNALNRLGYITSTNSISEVEKEISRSIPENLKISYVEINDEPYPLDEIFYKIQFYSNGQCDPFRIVLSNNRNRSIEIYSDSISGKVTSNFL